MACDISPVVMFSFWGLDTNWPLSIKWPGPGVTQLPGYLDKLRLVGRGRGGGLSPIAASKSPHCTHPRHLLYTSLMPPAIDPKGKYTLCADVHCTMFSTPTLTERYMHTVGWPSLVNRALCEENFEMTDQLWSSLNSTVLKFKVSWIYWCFGLDLKYCVKYLKWCRSI